MTVRSLLTILSDGQFHSGQELGDALGVSRSAIWKHIHNLQENGLDIYSVKGRGYRVPEGLSLLDAQHVKSKLSKDALVKLREVSLGLSVDSTNEQAMKACQLQDCHGALYLAEQQTAGRGRRGRTWQSPFARNLYFSLVWRFEQGLAALEGLSLLVGLCVVNALESMGVDDVQVKWPNDLLYKGRKLAGILVEVNGEASGQCQVVLGIGINVDMPNSASEAIDQPWVDLKSIVGRRIDRNELLAAILDELFKHLSLFERDGFAGYVSSWQRCHAFQNMEIKLSTARGDIYGICRGVNASGALLVDTVEGLELFHGGEVSVRKHDNS